MKIAICDDEKIFRTGLKDHLIAYKNEKKIQIDIYEFENGNDYKEITKLVCQHYGNDNFT